MGGSEEVSRYCRGREKLQTRVASGELSEAEVLCIFFFDLGAAFTAQIDVQPRPPFVCFFTNSKFVLTELGFA
jgi:hypothetical protein